VQPNAWIVLAGATITALTTGLGPLPCIALRGLGRAPLGLSHAAAAGLMLAAAAALLYEGACRDAVGAVAGTAVGLTAAAAAGTALSGRQPETRLPALQSARQSIAIVAAMLALSFGEGVGVGVSYGGGQRLGVVLTLVVALENVPQGLAIGLVLVPAGESVASAAVWSIVSSLPQPAIALPAFLFVHAFAALLAPALGLAAGALAWTVLGELLPAARAEASTRAVAGAAVVAFIAMSAVQALLLEL
jgi:zinc transporter ZupT